MHDGSALTWREVMEKHHSVLVDELSARLDSDMREAVDRALADERSLAGIRLKAECEDARRSQVESLNQVLRRLRTADENRVLDLAAESCASYAEKVVVLVFESNQTRCAASAGIEGEVGAFDTDSAHAIVAAIENRDPVVALATEAEISPVLVTVFNAARDPIPDRKAYLFPIVARHTVMAVLVATGVSVSTAPLELLCEAAGMRIEACTQPVVVPAPQPPAREAQPIRAQPVLVQFAPGKTSVAAESPQPRAWDDLDADEQKLHLQAQRMARVRVAEMRLYNENELRTGIASGDIYGALQKSIDSAREQFRQAFLLKSSTMVDYLHLELLRSLAHDDDRLLGRNYPGPMV
jgi:hypothetical protein